MENNKIQIGFKGNFSIYYKKLEVIVNDVYYDISNLVSDEIWDIDGNEVFPKHPEIDWKIRTELIKITRKFVKSIDSKIDSDKIYC